MKPLLGVLSYRIRSCEDARGTPLCLTIASVLPRSKGSPDGTLFANFTGTFEATMSDNLDAFMKGLEFARTTNQGGNSLPNPAQALFPQPSVQQ